MPLSRYILALRAFGCQRADDIKERPKIDPRKAGGISQIAGSGRALLTGPGKETGLGASRPWRRCETTAAVRQSRHWLRVPGWVGSSLRDTVAHFTSGPNYSLRLTN
ncbi:hypothetical protein AAFF_G00329350 [Aldrovandia affinis]|uniref:Uncharacterized protein n=1 Tax=Aldrovandia affinis TaxID=143900 RepID=A0AAD7WQV3_9TELE|nr:hypothetical protein AAFF_G00329350 [Aldrovandia affinis]